MAVAMAGTLALLAETCVGNFNVRPRDSLLAIADTHFRDASQWTLIFCANEIRLRSGVFQDSPGDVLNLPCQEGGCARRRHSAAAGAGTYRDDPDNRIKLCAVHCPRMARAGFGFCL